MNNQKQIAFLPFICLLLLFSLCGCAEKKENMENANAESETRSNAGILLDGITGKSAVEHGRKTQNTIHDISKEQTRSLDQAMDL